MHRRALPALIAAASLSVVTACSSGGSDTAAEPPSSTATSASPSESTSASPSETSASSSSSAAAGEDVVTNPPSSTWQDAVEAARGDFDGELTKIELESQEGGGLEYGIDQVSATQEHEGEYDADSLERISQDTDDLGDDAAEEQAKVFDPADLIDLDEAATTARDEVDGTITKWKVEGKDTGQVIYEFDILPAGSSPGDDDREVQVDAKDGSIVVDS